MNYLKIYKNIIKNAKRQKRRKGKIYYENHHIVPRSLGGSDNSWNLVLLTAKEHFICHLLLVKIFKKDKIKYNKMLYAFYAMRMTTNSIKKSKVTSYIYSHYKEILYKEKSENMQGRGFRKLPEFIILIDYNNRYYTHFLGNYKIIDIPYSALRLSWQTNKPIYLSRKKHKYKGFLAIKIKKWETKGNLITKTNFINISKVISNRKTNKEIKKIYIIKKNEQILHFCYCTKTELSKKIGIHINHLKKNKIIMNSSKSEFINYYIKKYSKVYYDKWEGIKVESYKIEDLKFFSRRRRGMIKHLKQYLQNQFRR